MGITFESLQRMEKLALLKPKCKVLDIGSSNLYSASPEEITAFLRKHAPATPDIESFAKRLAAGSSYDPIHGGLNGAFVGELLEKAGMTYSAFDIADGYRTTILDLNHARLPEKFRGYFDLVLNFGTTEHILNQFNCFKVMHDATRVGGHIFHSLPALGYVDHGYITYTGRCLFDIAGYNEYEVVEFWFEGPAGRNNLYDSVRSYRTYFPALERTLAEIGRSENVNTLNELGIPDVSINIIYRKVKEKPFWGALESSTSVGTIPGTVTDSYSGSEMEVAVAPRPASPSLKHRVSRALKPFPALKSATRKTYHALRQAAYLSGLRPRPVVSAGASDSGNPSIQAYVNTGMDRPISFEEEARQLVTAIEKHPNDTSLKAKLTTVNHTIGMGLMQDSVRFAADIQSGNPGDYWANYNLALSYLYYWRPLDAWSYALKAIEIDPTQKYGYELLFNIVSRFFDYRNVFCKQLVDIFDQALTKYPDLDLYREENFLVRQQAGIEKNIPPILINTLPKSGTIYIRGKLSEALDIPYQQLALSPIYIEPLPSWLNIFAKGGSISAEHLTANHKTIKLLNEAGLKRMVLHVRDPRESALSFLHFQAKQSGYSGPIGTVAGDPFRAFTDINEAFRRHCDIYIPWTMEWLRGWMEYANKGESGFSIKFTTYENFLKSEEQFFFDLLDYLDINPELFKQSKPLSEKHNAHFRIGKLGEWRETFNEPTQEYVSSLMDKDVSDFFNWQK